MTRQRNDKNSTEFGLWLRQQKEIDSSLGYVTNNIDYVWENYKTGDWMLIEEKRYMSDLTYSQKNQFRKMYKRINKDKKFHGWNLLQFEKTNPEDGKIFWNKKEITKKQLLEILKFNL